MMKKTPSCKINDDLGSFIVLVVMLKVIFLLYILIVYNYSFLDAVKELSKELV